MELETEVGAREEKQQKGAEDLEYREKRGFVQPADPLQPNSDPREIWQVALDRARQSGVVSSSQEDALEVGNAQRRFAAQLSIGAQAAENRLRPGTPVPFSLSQLSSNSAYERRADRVLEDGLERSREFGRHSILSQEDAERSLADWGVQLKFRQEKLWPLLMQGDYGVATILYQLQLREVARVCRDQLYLWNNDSRLWERRPKGTLVRAVSTAFEAMMREQRNEWKIHLNGTIGITDLEKLERGLKMSSKVGGVVTQLWPLLERENQDFADELDMSAHELPLADGLVIDLRTKEVRPRNITDYWTKALKVRYQPEKGTDRAYQLFREFAKFDEELVTSLRSIFGYSMTRDNEVRQFYIHLGDSFNGKSTCFELLSEILEHFMMPVKVELFTSAASNASGAASPELMCLATVRLAWISEWKENQVISEEMVKGFTGGDRKVGRGLYENDMRAIRPRFKLHIPTNYAPVYDASSKAMNRRNRNVPWKNVFNPSKEAADRIKAMDLSEIFTWLVEGAYQFYKDYSVKTCSAITEATASHIHSLDTVRQFIDERYVIDNSYAHRRPDQYSVTVIAAWDEYENWCKDNNIADKLKVKQHKFAKNLKLSYGVMKSPQLQYSGRKGYYYLALRPVSLPAEEEEEKRMPLGEISLNISPWVNGS